MTTEDRPFRVRDDLGREVALPTWPEPGLRRVVSLCPSVTETIFELGAGSRLAGRTRYCIRPATAVDRVSEVGGTRSLRVDRVLALAPDLVLAVKEENEAADIERLTAEGVPVFVFDVKDVSTTLHMIRSLGTLLGRDAAADELTQQIRAECALCAAPPRVPDNAARMRVLYLIWRDPWMAAGTGTYIANALAFGGFTNIASEPRYPTIGEAMLREFEGDAILLSSEPFPFTHEHIEEVRRLVPPRVKVVLVDGESFSWYGSRTRHLPAALRSLHLQLLDDR